MIQNTVIIWGIDNFNTLGLLRQLGEDAKLFLLVYGNKTGCATSSKYCKSSAAEKTIDGGFEYLKKHFSREDYKPIIITPSDEIIEYIDQHKEAFEQYFIVPGTGIPGELTKYDNKIEMARLAKEIGMCVPFSMICMYDTPLDDVEFPCFLKPSHITCGHKNEFKCKKVNTRKELESIMKLVRKDSIFLLQQYIPTEKEYVVSGCRMMDGRTIFSGTYTTLRYADDGNSSYATIEKDIPEMIDQEKMQLFLEKIDYHGIFGFEFGLWDGKAYFFEVNLRNDGTSQTFFLAGANRVLAWVYNVIGLDDTQLCVKVQKPGTFMDELFDVSNVWHGRIKTRDWRKQRQEATYLKYIYPNDMKPYEVMRKQRFRLILQYAIVKKFRPYIVYLLDMKNKLFDNQVITKRGGGNL